MAVSTVIKTAVLGLCIALFTTAPAVVAEIKFKKVGTAKKNGKRINVQIDPEDDYYKRVHREKMEKQKNKGATRDATKPETKAAKLVPASPGDLQEWFWKSNSPALAKAGSGKLHSAMQSLSANPSKSAKLSPNIAHMQKLADKFGGNILLATLGKDISPALVLAVIGVESGGRTSVVSSAGAVGVMQLIPATAARFKVTDSTDAAQNIKGGAAYLAWLLKEFKRDPLLALAGYNAGENAVKKHNGVPPYPETRAYVPKVVAAWQVARTLCMTPPKYATDGCVFKTRASK